MLAWILVFMVSLTIMIKGADWFLISAEKIGIAIGLSPFIVGVTIVAMGTSLPELFTSIMAGIRGTNEIIVSNVVGSNVANILLIVGLSAILGRKLVVKKDLINIDLPLLAGSMAIFGAVIFPWAKGAPIIITRLESAILLFVYGAYLFYTIFQEDDRILESEKDEEKKKIKPKILLKDFLILAIGGLCLILGAKYLIDSVVKISNILNIGVGVISILAVALGTSLPELLVSVKAAVKGKSEIALGNILGSNIFNATVVIGIPGIFKNLNIDETTYMIGIPFMMVATLLFVLSGISKRIHNWEGIFYISFYIIFIGKILNLF